MRREVYIARSFQDAEEHNVRQYKRMTAEERLEIIQELRERSISQTHKENEYRESREGLFPDGTPWEEEFVRLLNEHEIRYLVVGAYAVGFHSEPRNTGDIDIWVEPTRKNAKKVTQVLKNFGFSNVGIAEEEILDPDLVIQLGYPPVRIDILSSISAVEFQAAFQSRVEGIFGSTKASFLSAKDLIRSKESTGRTRDRADAETLRKYIKVQE